MQLSEKTVQTFRDAGFEAGYWAACVKTFVPNPHEFNTDAFHHWADGYDLGVLTSRMEQEIEEETAPAFGHIHHNDN